MPFGPARDRSVEQVSRNPVKGFLGYSYLFRIITVLFIGGQRAIEVALADSIALEATIVHTGHVANSFPQNIT